MTETVDDRFPVFDRVPGQDHAIAFLRQAAARPHHAYVLAGPEGGGKQLAARAFAAALLCKEGGCGTCRDCRLALEDRHPNEVVVEPEGRDIHVETVRTEIWHPAYRTAPEPGRKVFVIREADRLNPAAADVLLKVLEEPPADAVLMLLSARPDELPETVLSRCHVVSFRPLSEAFVAQTLAAEGIDPGRAALAARLAGGNLGTGSPARERRRRDVVPRGGPRRARGRRAWARRRARGRRARAGRGRALPQGPRRPARGGARAVPGRTGPGRGGVPRRDPPARGATQAAGPPRRTRLRGPGAARGLGAAARSGGRRGGGRRGGADEPRSLAHAGRRDLGHERDGRGRGGASRARRGPEPQPAARARAGVPPGRRSA